MPVRTPTLLALLFAASAFVGAPSCQAQMVVDTVYSWRGYARTAACRVRIFKNPTDEKRDTTVLLDELAANTGPTITADADYLVDEIGRAFRFDPTKTRWVFRWSRASFVDSSAAGPPSNKQLLLLATFRRTKSGTIGTPNWKIADPEALEEYTDRQVQLSPQQRSASASGRQSLD